MGPKLRTPFAVLALTVAGLVGTPTASACTCAANAGGQAAATASLIGAGSSLLSLAMTQGFESVAATVEASRGQSTQQIVAALELLTKRLTLEMRTLPARQEALDAEMEAASPARQATAPCAYTGRASDKRMMDSLVGLTETNLNSTSARFANVPSQYPDGVDKAAMHNARTAKLLQENPAVMAGASDLVEGPSSFGSMTEEEFQLAAIAVNLTLDDKPPAKVNKPISLAGVAQNAEADIHNIRMSFPRAVTNQILAYEAPVLDASEDSWIAEQLENIAPDLVKDLPEDRAISYSDFLTVMATHRVKDPVWVAMLANKGYSGSLKDLALVKADSLLMDYEIWKQDKNMALLTAQLLANQTRQERESQTNE